MSVVKSKRGQSKIEFEQIYFQLVDNIDNLLEHNFYAGEVIVEKNKVFVATRSASLERFTDDLLYFIKIANSIYPTCIAEWEERRVAIGKAIGVCYAILTNYQRVMIRLRVSDEKYAMDVRNIMRMINSLKAWRKSDNKLKDKLK